MKLKGVTRPKVQDRKLGREGADGLCWQGCGLIEIDPRQSAKSRLDTLIHEMLHHYNNDWTEEHISKVATDMCHIIWANRYRRIEK